MAAGSIRMGSERSFGFVFAGVFVIVSLYPALHGGAPRIWALAFAAVFLVAGLVTPRRLAPLNRLWFRFGLALGKVMSPVVMGLLFAIAVVPTGLVLKLLRKDPLKLRLDRTAATYWERRKTQPGPMSDQF